jgi:hypothetical protein
MLPTGIGLSDGAPVLPLPLISTAVVEAAEADGTPRARAVPPLRVEEMACNGLFLRLEQMEMRRATSARSWVGPPRNDFRIRHDLVM